MTEEPAPGEPVVFLPSQRVQRGDQELILELRRDPEGRVGVLAFSSLDLLVAGCGEFQPWVAVPAGTVQSLAEDAGAEVVMLDVALAPDQRHTEDELVAPNVEARP